MAGLSPEAIEALMEGPADNPPNGTVPDFNAKSNYDGQGIAIVAICAALVAMTSILRAYSRIRAMRTIFLEDYLALAGLASYIVFVWSTIEYITLGGFYVHQWNIRLRTMLDITLRLYVYSVSYTASMGFAKAAILLEWKRIFVPRGTRDAFFWTAMALLVINVLLYLSVEIVVICSCVPPRKFWYPFIAGPCVNRRIVDTTAGSFNLATDIAIFLLPQRKIWSLRLSTSRKIGLAIVFSFGLVSCAAAIGRTHATVEAVYPTPGGGTGDTTYTASPQLLWCLAEVTCVYLVFCIPMIPGAFSEKTLLGRSMASIWSSWRSKRSKSSLKNTTGSSYQKRWPRVTINSSTQGRGHRLSDDTDQAVGLVDLGGSRTAHDSGAGTFSQVQEVPQGNILKTTEVEQRHDVANRMTADQYHHDVPYSFTPPPGHSRGLQ